MATSFAGSEGGDLAEPRCRGLRPVATALLHNCSMILLSSKTKGWCHDGGDTVIAPGNVRYRVGLA
jgi:hypothetical protein